MIDMDDLSMNIQINHADDPGNENPIQEITRSRQELFFDYLNCYTSYFQTIIACLCFFALICFKLTTFTDMSLLLFSNFFAYIVLISTIIEFITRSLNFNKYVPDIFKSSIILIGLYSVGTIVAFILGGLLIYNITFIALVFGGVLMVVVGILLSIPVACFCRTQYFNGYCLIEDFPI